MVTRHAKAIEDKLTKKQKQALIVTGIGTIGAIAVFPPTAIILGAGAGTIVAGNVIGKTLKNKLRRRKK